LNTNNGSINLEKMRVLSKGKQFKDLFNLENTYQSNQSNDMYT